MTNLDYCRKEKRMSEFNYLKEKVRMLNSLGRKGRGCNGIFCKDCPLCSENNGTDCVCTEFEHTYPDKAIEIVRKWAEEHPAITYVSMMLDRFPNANIKRIKDITCPGYFYKNAPAIADRPDCEEDDACEKCWNQEVTPCD